MLNFDESRTWLITGGAGFLGINLVRYLLARNQRVISLDIADFDYPERDRITEIRGDIRGKGTLDLIVRQGVDVIVHCAAALPLYSPEDIWTTDVDGTRRVLQSALDHGVKRVVHISSTAVYGIPDHHPLFEDDRLMGVGPYGEAKVEAEQVCREFWAQGLPVTILRPKSFVGPERLGVFALFYDWARTGHGFPMLGNGCNRYQLLDVEDLCEAIALAVHLDPSLASDVFNIGAGEFTTMREDFQSVLDAAGFGKRIKALPAAPAIWTLRLLEWLHLSPLYRWVYETATEDSFVAIDKAQRILGYQPRYSNQAALVRNYEWYCEHHAQFEGRSGISHRVPWKQGILSVAKRFF